MAKYEWNRPAAWDLAASHHQLPSSEQHRRSVTELLINSTTSSPASLCILGVGPANDLNLSQLADRFAQIELVDLQLELMQQAVRVQGVDQRSGIGLKSLEVTGIQQAIHDWSTANVPSEADLDRVIQIASNFEWRSLSLPVDVMASTCLLSQLVLSIVNRLGDQHPRFVECLQAIRARHLELLIEAVKPGGTALLVFDFVSSDSIPEIATLQGVPLQQKLAEALTQNNFFHGMHPLKMLSSARDYPPLASKIEQAALSLPWIWNTGSRQYAVCCLRMRRKSS